MLVLTRKNREAVVVGPSSGFERQLKVTVLDVTAGKVRLGFEIAAEVPIHRLEVWERIQSEKAASPEARETAPNEESDRWDDDGGRRDAPIGDPAALGVS